MQLPHPKGRGFKLAQIILLIRIYNPKKDDFKLYKILNN